MTGSQQQQQNPGPVVDFRPTTRLQWLFACRWPLAVVISSLILAGALLRILSQPIPIRIDGGGINVDRLVMPSSVTIRADGPLPVTADVTVDGDSRRDGDQPIQISGPVSVDRIASPVAIQGDVGARLKGTVQTTVDSIQAPIRLKSPVSIATEEPIQVKGGVTVDEPVVVDGAVDVNGEVDVSGAVGIDGKVRTRIGF
ncbi:hypothetical protein [Synechococcus sp. CC9616]|uniref:hypothetical protein n=1 Tax=Synechococcus sp. CC9616 TaxID=110663 RepID=UPI0006846F9E|nr:hypothetical protein [Synechococcus sp. CC9616]